MITKKIFRTIDELQEVQRLAQHTASEVAFHSPDSSIIIDAKSYIGMYALNFKEPVLVVSEDKAFHEAIKNVGETVA